MRLLVTRPREDAEETVEALAAAGHAVAAAPLLEVRPRPGATLDLEGVQAVLITSRNGLRALAASTPRRDLPVYAVGPSSAEAARAAGFATVVSADGDAEALAARVVAELDPAAGMLLHPAGTVSAGALSAGLEAAGFRLRRVVLYEARTAESLSDTARTALQDEALDGVLFFSPRTARTFASLVGRAGLAERCTRLRAYCLSDAVAAAAQETLAWQAVRVAPRPNQPALLAVIADDAAERTRTGSMAEDDKSQTPETGEDNAAAPGEPAAADAAGNPAERVIARFGGLRPMASKLGIAVSTVQGWKTRGQIPHARHAEIRTAAAAHGIDLDEAELAAADSTAAGEAEKPAEAPAAEARGPWVPAEPPAGDARETRELGGSAPAPEEAPEAPRETAAPRMREAEAPAPAARPGGRAGPLVAGALVAAIALSLGAGAAVLLREQWQPYLGAPSGDALDALQQRLQALEARPVPDGDAAALQALRDELAALRTRVDDLAARLEERAAGGDAALAEKVEAMAQRLEETAQQSAAAIERVGALERNLAAREDLSARLAALESRAASQETVTTLSRNQQAIDERVAALSERLGATEQNLIAARQQVEQALASVRQASGPAARNAALALAAGQLREALRFGTPFDAALAPVVELVGDDAELDAVITPLTLYAESGVATLESLRARFPQVAADVVAAARSDAEPGWSDEVMQRLSELVTIRPVGEIEGDDAPAVVARAERRLAAGDLGAAVAELETLDGAAGEAAAGWLYDAKARLQVESALAELSRRVVQRLSAEQEG